MALPSSGAISIGAINTEFGRASTAQTSMSQLYRGGGIVTSNNTNVPTSGQISLSQFYGASNLFTFVIASNQTNANLRTLAVNAGWNQSSAVQATINSGIYCSSNSTGTPALTVSGSFPGGVSLINNGIIVGQGGGGWTGATARSILPATDATPGGVGGLALSASIGVTITNNGTIAGGGGGGGGGGGRRLSTGEGTTVVHGGGGGGGRSGLTNSAGGAAGGSGASAGGSGTVSAAGSGGAGESDDGLVGGQGGNGGGLGSAGAAGLAGSGGTTRGSLAAGGGGGAAVSGNGNITWIAFGTRLGAIT